MSTGKVPLILVVENDEDVRASTRLLLEAMGYGVSDYPSAEDFLAATAGQGGDCLLLDLHMSGMTGLELLQHLRGRGIDTPAIVVTGGDLSEAAFARAGVLAVLRKPHPPEDLLRWIAQACSGA